MINLGLIKATYQSTPPQETITNILAFAPSSLSQSSPSSRKLSHKHGDNGILIAAAAAAADAADDADDDNVV